ncbi:hypothetical protein GCM10027341_40240 [Spirosoma knui]
MAALAGFVLVLYVSVVVIVLVVPVLLVEYVPDEPLLSDPVDGVVEYVLLLVAFVLSVVTGDVYVGFVAVLVVEYEFVVVWPYASAALSMQTESIVT